MPPRSRRRRSDMPAHRRAATRRCHCRHRAPPWRRTSGAASSPFCSVFGAQLGSFARRNHPLVEIASMAVVVARSPCARSPQRPTVPRSGPSDQRRHRPESIVQRSSRFADRSRFDGPFETLRVAERAHRQRRARQMQSACDPEFSRQLKRYRRHQWSRSVAQCK